jgi:hypothetical protein
MFCTVIRIWIWASSAWLLPLFSQDMFRWVPYHGDKSMCVELWIEQYMFFARPVFLRVRVHHYIRRVDWKRRGSRHIRDLLFFCVSKFASVMWRHQRHGFPHLSNDHDRRRILISSNNELSGRSPGTSIIRLNATPHIWYQVDISVLYMVSYWLDCESKKESCDLREKWVTIAKVSNVDFVVGLRGIRITCPTNCLIVARWKEDQRIRLKHGSIYSWSSMKTSEHTSSWTVNTSY